MARTASTENLSPVTGSITVELREALEEHRWAARMTMSQVVRTGLESWAKDQGIWSPEGDKATDDKATGDKADEGTDDKAGETTDDKADETVKDDAADAEASTKTTSRSRK